MLALKNFAKVSSFISAVNCLNDHEVAEVNALLIDIKDNLQQYISLEEHDADFTLPECILQIYTQISTYTDDSYSSLFTAVDFGQVTAVMDHLEWYSERIQPLMTSYFKNHGVTETMDPGASSSSLTDINNRPFSSESLDSSRSPIVEVLNAANNNHYDNAMKCVMGSVVMGFVALLL